MSNCSELPISQISFLISSPSNLAFIFSFSSFWICLFFSIPVFQSPWLFLSEIYTFLFDSEQYLGTCYVVISGVVKPSQHMGAQYIVAVYLSGNYIVGQMPMFRSRVHSCCLMMAHVFKDRVRDEWIVFWVECKWKLTIEFMMPNHFWPTFLAASNSSIKLPAIIS